MSENIPTVGDDKTRRCPVCETRVGQAATKCIVCGSDLDELNGKAGVRENRRKGVFTDGANVSVPLPLTVGVVMLMLLGGLALLLVSAGRNPFASPTATVMPTPTLVPTFTPAPTSTATQVPSSTPLPPVTHTVEEGDTCILIAVTYDISVQSILQLNGFTQACPLRVGQEVFVPVPTPTQAATATATMVPLALTQAARPMHVVTAGESLSSIAADYGVSFSVMADVNGKLPPDYAITIGETLSIPVDMPIPTAGPTPTETSLPPYAAPQLLNPSDGAAISSIEQTVSLQWTSIATLRENEVYLVSVEDVTEGGSNRISDTTLTTRYIIDVNMKPREAVPHVFKWTVVTARQTGITDDGRPMYQPAGSTSVERTFTWTGIGLAPVATSTLTQ